MLRTHHGLPHHERGKHAAPLTTTHSRTRVQPPEPRGEAAGGVCAPGFCGFCGLRDSGGRRVPGGRRVSAPRRASARSRGCARVARAAAGMALLRSLSPEVLGTRVVLFIEVVLFHARAGRAQAHDRPVLYTRIVQSSLQARSTPRPDIRVTPAARRRAPPCTASTRRAPRPRGRRTGTPCARSSRGRRLPPRAP